MWWVDEMMSIEYAIVNVSHIENDFFLMGCDIKVFRKRRSSRLKLFLDTFYLYCHLYWYL